MSKKDWMDYYPLRRDWAGQRMKERHLVLDSFLFTLKENGLNMFLSYLMIGAIWCICDQYGLFEYIRTHNESCTEFFELKVLLNSILWCTFINIVFFIRWYYKNKEYIDKCSFLNTNFDVFKP